MSYATFGVTGIPGIPVHKVTTPIDTPALYRENLVMQNDVRQLALEKAVEFCRGSTLEQVEAAFQMFVRLLTGSGEAPKIEEPAPLVPAIPLKQRFTKKPGYIICLDDGKAFKSMKRHLRMLGMTPAQYRAKWGLPVDDPIVSEDYSVRRSALAKANGLGRKAS